MRRTKKKLSEIEYEYVFSEDAEARVQEVYSLIFEELENATGIFSFKCQKNDKSKQTEASREFSGV